MDDDQPMWANNRAVAPTPAAAIVAVNLGENFNVKGHHLSMIKDRQFDCRAQADPHKHIVEFIEICGMFRYANTNADSIKLKLFSSSLVREANLWYNELSPGVIATWEQMRQAFDEEPSSESSTMVLTMPPKPSLTLDGFFSIRRLTRPINCSMTEYY
ncbi:hypothetical protein Tco_0929457 [Tanacetum coccineum]